MIVAMNPTNLLQISEEFIRYPEVILTLLLLLANFANNAKNMKNDRKSGIWVLI